MGKILLFNINIFKKAQIDALCRDLNIETAAIQDSGGGKSLGMLAGLEPGPVNMYKNTAITSGGSPASFSEEMMVLCGLEPDSFDRFLDEYRNRNIQPVELKAVLTAFNAKWTPARLCTELKKEHRQFNPG